MTIHPFEESALVLGGDVNGVAVIRSLGRLGVRCGLVHAGARSDHARHSRYLECLEIVAGEADDHAVVSAIRDVAGRLAGRAVVVVPTTDRYSQVLSRNRDRFGPEFRICNPEQSTCEIFLDKWRTAELCTKNGLLIPDTACPQSLVELSEVAARITYPVIVKPRYTFGTGFPGKNAVFQNARGLCQFLANDSLLGRCVVQQIVRSGDGDILVTATYSSARGSVEAIYSGRKLRQYLPDYGATCFGISERHPTLEAVTRKLLDGIGYQGFAALEFARSRDDGKAYFLELNTRTYYHNQLFADAGMDLTQVAFLEATGRDFKSLLSPLSQHDGLIWLDFRRDFQSMRIKRRQDRITFASWLRSILSARSFAYWNSRDPLPFLAACVWRTGVLFVNLLKSVRSSRWANK